MGKKKKRDKGYKFYESYQKRGKKGKKKDKNKKDYRNDGPAFKTMKLTLSKQDIKEAKKIVLAPVDVPKDFIKIRHKCNHAGDLISVKDFRNMSPTYSAFTPALDRVVEVFGEDSVSVCAACYDVIVDQSKIGIDDVQHAITTLYVAANKAVSMRRLKDDEVKDISKMKDELSEWGLIVDMLEKIEEKLSRRQTSGQTGGFTRSLNDIGNSPIIT